jgi:hypothetical protein
VRLRRVNPWLRPGLFFLGAQAAVVGGWALVSPRSFYGDFPIIGGSWVDALPPYNEHLVRDVGGLFAGFALLFFIAAFVLEPVLIRVAMIAWLPFAIAHFLFHATHLGGLTFIEKVLQMVTLGIVLLVPLSILWALRRRTSSTFL